MSRLSIALFSCVTIPILTALAYIDGTKVVRQELSHWRDGVGLTAIVIVSVNWLFQVLLWIPSSISFGLTRFYNPDWFALQMYTSLAATLLAIALKRAPRLQTIAAGLLMQAFLRVFVYTWWTE
jgi:hypothetical protein